LNIAKCLFVLSFAKIEGFSEISKFPDNIFIQISQVKNFLDLNYENILFIYLSTIAQQKSV